MKKFLVIDTSTDDGHSFIHFIELSDDEFLDDIFSLFNHMKVYFPHQHLKRVYFADTRLSNW